MSQPIIDQIITNIKYLLAHDNTEGALKILKQEISPISKNLATSIVLLSGRYARLKNQQMNGDIRPDDFNFQKTRLSKNMLSLTETIPSEIETKRILGGGYSSIYTTTSQSELEKIQGPENNLLPMNWIYKCVEASKSICKVVKNDGKSGTGWLLEGGWMMTNFHVIPKKEWVDKFKIVFNYEDDLHGSRSETSTYTLNPEGAIFSSIMKLDYAFIKVNDDGNVPLSTWGHLEVDTFADPQPGQPVSIIQHPKGRRKEIALTKNSIVNVDGRKIFYMTDTEKGSSGSPVLNLDWKVVALHHAGKTEEEGGLVIDTATGEKKGANEGILIKDIMKDIESQRK